jgi:hypothetical protein
MQYLSIAWFAVAAASAVFAIRRILPRPGAARIVVMALVVAAVPLILFAWWGQYTIAGHRAYDEMDGLYPFAAGALGLTLTIVAALAAWLATRRRGSNVQSD